MINSSITPLFWEEMGKEGAVLSVLSCAGSAMYVGSTPHTVSTLHKVISRCKHKAVDYNDKKMLQEN